MLTRRNNQIQTIGTLYVGEEMAQNEKDWNYPHFFPPLHIQSLCSPDYGILHRILCVFHQNKMLIASSVRYTYVLGIQPTRRILLRLNRLYSYIYIRKIIFETWQMSWKLLPRGNAFLYAILSCVFSLFSYWYSSLRQWVKKQKERETERKENSK